MKKIKISFNKNAVKNILLFAIRRGRLFLIVFFGVLLIYSFNVIYKNVYLDLNYIDYSESFSVGDIKRESVVIKRMLRDIKERDMRIKDGISKYYKDPFNFKSSAVEDVNTGKNDEDDSVPRDLSNGLIRPGR